VSESAVCSRGPVARKASYLLHKVRYDSFQRLLLDGLKPARVQVTPYRLYHEGLELASGNEQAATRLAEFSYRPLRPVDIPVLAALPGRQYSERSLAGRMKSGEIAVGAWRGEDLAAFTWCNLKVCATPLHPFSLEPDEAYLFDAYTVPRFRGGGLAPHIRRMMYTELASMGRTRLYSITESLNKPAIRFKEKLNAELLDTGLVIEVWSRWRYVRRANGYRIGS